MATKEKIPDWKALEQLVVMIQKQLSPGAVVKHNVMLDGYRSEVKRQIDVLVEQSIGQYKMRIIIDCKDWAHPIDIKGVEEFHGLMLDVNAHKGALVCPAGFTKAALKCAQKLQIDLYRPVSTGDHKWKAEVTAPIICDFRDTFMSFRLKYTSPKPFRISEQLQNIEIFNSKDEPLGTLIEIALEHWNNGYLPSEPGEHRGLDIFKNERIRINNGYGEKVEVAIDLNLAVSKALYLGHLPIEDIHGLQDVNTGNVVANAFTLGGLNPHNIRHNWENVISEESLPFEPLLKVIGYNCSGIYQ